jgi:hypothetical protein
MLPNLLWHYIRVWRWWHKKFALLSAHRNLKAHIIKQSSNFISANPTCTLQSNIWLYPSVSTTKDSWSYSMFTITNLLEKLMVFSSLNYVHIFIFILRFHVLHSCYSGPEKLLNWMIIFRYPVWCKITNKRRSHITAFCIETRLCTAWQRKCDSIPGMGVWFISSPKHRLATGLMKPPIQWVLETVSLGKETREWCQPLTCIQC